MSKLITSIRSKKINVQQRGIKKLIFVRVEPKNTLGEFVRALDEAFKQDTYPDIHIEPYIPRYNPKNNLSNFPVGYDESS